MKGLVRLLLPPVVAMAAAVIAATVESASQGLTGLRVTTVALVVAALAACASSIFVPVDTVRLARRVYFLSALLATVFAFYTARYPGTAIEFEAEMTLLSALLPGLPLLIAAGLAINLSGQALANRRSRE